jgi:hypothetical protein
MSTEAVQGVLRLLMAQIGPIETSAIWPLGDKADIRLPYRLE